MLKAGSASDSSFSFVSRSAHRAAAPSSKTAGRRQHSEKLTVCYILCIPLKEVFFAWSDPLSQIATTLSCYLLLSHMQTGWFSGGYVGQTINICTFTVRWHTNTVLLHHTHREKQEGRLGRETSDITEIQLSLIFFILFWKTTCFAVISAQWD